MRALVFLAALTLAPAVFAQDTPATDPVATADALMEKRGLKNLKKAAALYKEALDKKPDDLDLMLKRADALNGIMRVRTNGNSLLIKGMSDTGPHKKIWGQYGPEADRLAKKVYEARPKSLKALAVYTDAYMFNSSRFGILEALMKGAADQYKANARALIKRAPKHDGGLGHVFMGAFYTVAPWPLSDDDKAMEHMMKAYRIQPKSKRNAYYVGVVAYRNGEHKKAVEFFKKAQSVPCASATEIDFCGFMKRELKRVLPIAEKEAD